MYKMICASANIIFTEGKLLRCIACRFQEAGSIFCAVRDICNSTYVDPFEENKIIRTINVSFHEKDIQTGTEKFVTIF